MKKKILLYSDNFYSTSLEIEDVFVPRGSKVVRVTSTFVKARVPDEERKVWEMYLDKDTYKRFINFLLENQDNEI